MKMKSATPDDVISQKFYANRKDAQDFSWRVLAAYYHPPDKTMHGAITNLGLDLNLTRPCTTTTHESVYVESKSWRES